MRSWSPTELVKKFESGEKPLLLDVRTPAEVESQGSLPFETVHIPLGQLWDKAVDLPKDREIVAFCKISVRGWDAYAILRRLGFTNLSVLEGGVAGWPFDLK